MLPALLTRAGLKALPWHWIVTGLAALAAVGAAFYLLSWYDSQLDAARLDGYSSGHAAATMAAQSAALRLDIERREREQQDRAAIDREIEHARQATESLASDRDRARAESDRLRVAARAAAARSCPRAASPAPASSSPTAASPADLLADVLLELERAGAEVAQEADRRRIAGLACERISEAVR